MTIVAGDAEATCMRIVRGVALVTFGGSFAVTRAGSMTAVAARQRVPAEKRQIRELMPKVSRVESYDRGGATLVLGMTCLARAASHGRFESVEAAFPVQVRRHVAVASDAEAVLRGLVERRMALLTFVLDARVLLDQVTGHHERLDPRSTRVLRTPRQTRQHQQLE